MVEINGRPLLDYWMELLWRGGIEEVLVNTHYFPGVVTSYIQTCQYPLRITTTFEERLLGTGGTLLGNRNFFRDEPAMLVHADNLSIFDVSAFIERFEQRRQGIEITMMTFNAPTPESCGIVELDDREIVRAFHEKVKNPPGNLANGAVYVTAPTVMNFLADLNKKTIDFSTEVLPHYLGSINTFHNDSYHRDIGTVESLLAAQTEYPIAAARKSSQPRST